MNQLRPVALIAAGGVARPTLVRLPNLTERLGPVKASSFRVASRLVNSLRAGRAVSSYDSLAECRLILISVPDARVPSVAVELETSDLDWDGRVVVLTDSCYDSAAFDSLQSRGALVASVDFIAGQIVAEGDRTAIREFRRQLLPRTTRILRLAPGGKALLLAGLTIASLPAHLAAAAASCCRAAGANASQSRAMIERLMSESLHAYIKAGGNAINVEWSESQRKAVKAQLEALRVARPDLAEFYSMLIYSTSRQSGRLAQLTGILSRADLAI